MLNSFPAIAFADKVDVFSSTVVYSLGLLFICGGECADLDKSPLSVRDHVLRYITDTRSDILSRTLHAEDMQSWLDSGAFDDLVLFEKVLASLADRIVVIVESPGSIAELGAFSFIEEISEKLLVFISSTYRESNSFITLGPIKKLIKNNDSCVKFYDWGSARSDKISADLEKVQNLAESIVVDIEESINRQNVKRKYDEKNIEHIMLLVCDIVSMFPSLQLKEIISVVMIMGIEVSTSDMRGYLYVLVKAGVLTDVSYGETYYLIGKKYESVSFLKYKIKDQKVMHDRSRAKCEYIGYLNSTNDPKDRKRLKVIKESR